MEIIGKTNRSVLPKGKHQREKWVSENDKKKRRKFRNHRNDHNYLSGRQAAIAVEESMVNDKNNYLQQKFVEAKEAATRNQT